MSNAIKLIAAIIIFPVYISVFLLLLIFWEIVLRILPANKQNNAVKAFNKSIYDSLKLLGTSYRVESAVPDLSNIPCIIVSNHQSMFDMPWLYTVFNKYHPRYVAKIELAKGIPGISLCLKKGGSALIDRKNSRQSLAEIQALAIRMKEQCFSTVIFPEGTRARDGKLKKFKTTGIRELCSNLEKTALIPVAIDNSWQLMRYKYGPIPVLCALRMRIGQPVIIENLEQIDPAIELALERVAQELKEIRGE